MDGEEEEEEERKDEGQTETMREKNMMILQVWVVCKTKTKCVFIQTSVDKTRRPRFYI